MAVSEESRSYLEQGIDNRILCDYVIMWLLYYSSYIILYFKEGTPLYLFF